MVNVLEDVKGGVKELETRGIFTKVEMTKGHVVAVETIVMREGGDGERGGEGWEERAEGMEFFDFCEKAFLFSSRGEDRSCGRGHRSSS